MQCHQRYLLESSEYAHCMSCRKVWNREILVNEFTNVFVNKAYKEHREKVLFERERSLMPETQRYVEVELKCRSHQNMINKLVEQRNLLHQRNVVLHSQPLETMGYETYIDSRIEKQRRLFEIGKQDAVLRVEIEFHNTVMHLYRTNGITNERRVFVRACPVNGCKGFLSTAWKCGLCEAKVCSKCHEVKVGDDDAHMCDPGSVASAELISRDSRPCPKCASMIFKIEGCDQMYCTQCQTAFSWRTGRVETGVIHNPHYYDYMRRLNGGVAPRNPGDVPCGGLPGHSLYTGTTLQTAYPQEQIRILYNIHQNIAHIQHADMFRFRPTPEDEARKLRVKYMMNDISELDFKRKLQQREKHDTKQREIREVVTLYTTIATDIMQRIAQSPRTNLFSEFLDLREYVKGLFEKVGTRWKCVVPMFEHGGYRLLI